MDVVNVHERLVGAGKEEVGALLDALGGEGDRLWPRRAWPPMVLDRPLAVGATGGHGRVRYTVAAYVPGVWVRFVFRAPRGFHGFHEFAVLPVDERRTVLRHTLAIRARRSARFTVPFFWQPLHDACLEDALDRAEWKCADGPTRPARWSPYVRLLRWVGSRGKG
ncbi:SRPBCC family protein [Streptomyces mobaraensis]|uniref:SRPBCC family protein n=1 Tax=Streptomyces mobaraensis TaxID=35621 RepID=UPI00332B28FE